MFTSDPAGGIGKGEYFEFFRTLVGYPHYYLPAKLGVVRDVPANANSHPLTCVQQYHISNLYTFSVKQHKGAILPIFTAPQVCSPHADPPFLTPPRRLTRISTSKLQSSRLLTVDISSILALSRLTFSAAPPRSYAEVPGKYLFGQLARLADM